MLNVKDMNRYFLRLMKLDACPEISGQVIYLRRISTEGMIISKTDDCRPLPELIPLPATSNDNGWYDATELILAANCAITPRYDLCVFDNDTAKQYRNHIDSEKVLRTYDSREAVGKLCFLGRKSQSGIELSPTAYFVVYTDDQGFSVAYSGFCNPKQKKHGNTHRLTQRILRLEGSGQSFFDAASVVAFCNASYKQDVDLRDKYISAISDKVATTSTSTTHAEQHKSQADGLSGLNLS